MLKKSHQNKIEIDRSYLTHTQSICVHMCAYLIGA